MICKMIVTADWHLGAINPNDFYAQLENTLFKKLDDLDNSPDILDYLIIAGDIFDSKQYFSSDAVSVAFRILDKLSNYESTIQNIIILNGTRTHDADQLWLLAEVSGNIVTIPDGRGVPITYVDTVTKFEDGSISMLLIPEEYIDNQDIYYEKYFSDDKHYDFIFGHGMIDKIWYAKKNKEEHGATQITSAPVFKLDDLISHANYTMFGHVHTHKFYNGDKFRYLGPVTRWEFGSSTDVGITYIEYDKDKGVITKDEFIKNDFAPILPTRIINLMNKDEYSLDELNNMVDDILAEELANGASKVRFIVNLNNKLENSGAVKDFFITKIGEIPIAKLVISNDFDKDIVNNMKDVMELDKKTLDYVYNRNLDVEEQIKKFIQTHYGRDLSVDKIKEYLETE